MSEADDPAVARRRLRTALRGERDRLRLSREDAARRLDWSLSKLVRIESGHQGISVTDLRSLLDLYEVTDARLAGEYADLARASRRQAWWAGYREIISRQLGQYLGYESVAGRIDVFHPFLVPGLLHTADYATALLRGRKPDDLVRRLVDLRMERQDRLLGLAEDADQPDGTGRPQVSFIFGEEALARPIGGPAVMARQLQHLLDAGARPGVSVRVVPFSRGAHPGIVGPFILVSLRESGEDMLFLEGAAGDLVSRDDEEILSPFLDYFAELGDLACSEADSAALISRRLAELAEAELAPI
jgi:transcriptional regulator with XRE-family HTH domain